ncbi:MAG: hypothetical protein AAF358_14610 [Pseudomonadota bacterium]
MPPKESLTISWDFFELAVAAVTLLSLTAATLLAYRRWGRDKALWLLLALDLYVVAWVLPSRAIERVRVDDEWFSLVVGTWLDPIEIDIELAGVVVIYEVHRSRHWLERDCFWVFQDARFRRRRLALSPLLYRQRHRVAAQLDARGIPVIVHQNMMTN